MFNHVVVRRCEKSRNPTKTSTPGTKKFCMLPNLHHGHLYPRVYIKCCKSKLYTLYMIYTPIYSFTQNVDVLRFADHVLWPVPRQPGGRGHGKSFSSTEVLVTVEEPSSHPNGWSVRHIVYIGGRVFHQHSMSGKKEREHLLSSFPEFFWNARKSVFMECLNLRN